MVNILPASIAITAASMAGFYYVDKQHKTLKIIAELEPEDDEAKAALEMKGKIRMGLMGVSVIACLMLVYGLINQKKATSSFETRVTKAANNLRSSMQHMPASSMAPTSSMEPSSSAVSEDFAQRVSAAAARLRKQIEDAAPVASSATVEPTSDLAARASAEISQFIADNS